jgi:hypothetical protein
MAPMYGTSRYPYYVHCDKVPSRSGFYSLQGLLQPSYSTTSMLRFRVPMFLAFSETFPDSLTFRGNVTSRATDCRVCAHLHPYSRHKSFPLTLRHETVCSLSRFPLALSPKTKRTRSYTSCESTHVTSGVNTRQTPSDLTGIRTMETTAWQLDA